MLISVWPKTTLHLPEALLAEGGSVRSSAGTPSLKRFFYRAFSSFRADTNLKKRAKGDPTGQPRRAAFIMMRVAPPIEEAPEARRRTPQPRCFLSGRGGRSGHKNRQMEDGRWKIEDHILDSGLGNIRFPISDIRFAMFIRIYRRIGLCPIS